MAENLGVETRRMNGLELRMCVWWEVLRSEEKGAPTQTPVFGFTKPSSVCHPHPHPMAACYGVRATRE